MSWDFTADLWEWDADNACLAALGVPESVDLEAIDAELGWDDPAEMPEELVFVDDVDDTDPADELALRRQVCALTSELIEGRAA